LADEAFSTAFRHRQRGRQSLPGISLLEKTG
jgi:hypothetical protein